MQSTPKDVEWVCSAICTWQKWGHIGRHGSIHKPGLGLCKIMQQTFWKHSPVWAGPLAHPLPRVPASLTAAAAAWGLSAPGSTSVPDRGSCKEQLFLESQAVLATKAHLQTMPEIQAISSQSDFSLACEVPGLAQRLGHAVWRFTEFFIVCFCEGEPRHSGIPLNWVTVGIFIGIVWLDRRTNGLKLRECDQQFYKEIKQGS